MADKETRFFEIPRDQEAMIKLARAIPEEGWWFSGELHAAKPIGLLNRMEIAFKTDLIFDRTYLNFSGDLMPVLLQQKPPSSVRFIEAGYEDRYDRHGDFQINFSLTRRLAAGFIAKGYRGTLQFYKGGDAINKYDNEARCHMVFYPWRGGLTNELQGEIGLQPARVKLEWKKNDVGSERGIEPILNVCHSLRLKQYRPRRPRARVRN